MLPRSFYNCPAENQLDFGSWQGAVFLNIWCDDRLRDDTPATSIVSSPILALTRGLT